MQLRGRGYPQIVYIMATNKEIIEKLEELGLAYVAKDMAPFWKETEMEIGD